MCRLFRCGEGWVCGVGHGFEFRCMIKVKGLGLGFTV
jgi:hypothetical protein